MSITEYNNDLNITDYIEVNIGKLFFFKNFVITEFNEGITIDFENYRETVQAIESHFGTENFGFIANRVNSYSINLADAKRFNSLFPNLKAYAIVSDSPLSEGLFEVENHFLNRNRKIFLTLENAIDWVETYLDSI